MKKTGIKKTYVLSNNINGSDDNLRKETGNFWIIDSDSNDLRVFNDINIKFDNNDKNIVHCC